MSVEVVGHRVMLKPYFQEDVTDWGFKLDVGETHQREKAATTRGEIVGIGSNAWKAFDDGRPWAAVGDIVYFAKYGGKFIKIGEEDYIIVNDEDIQAIIKEEE